MKGRELKKWRTDQFLSQQNLADMLGLSLNTIWNWEHEHTQIPDPLVPLALEAIGQHRARLVRQLRSRQEDLAHQRRMKAIAQGKR